MTLDLQMTEQMNLYSRVIGKGPPVLVLHGLFGMSDNWVSIGNALADQGFSAHLVDLRNHGRSPHVETHRYPDMCEDLLHYLDQADLARVRIIGHSMGGKLAMMFGLLEPERVERLVIVDIAPSDYRDPKNRFHVNIIEVLQSIDLAQHESRESIREALTAELDDPATAMFLTKSLSRDNTSHGFSWKFNLPVLQKFQEHIHIGLEELEIYAPCGAPALFIRGEDSTYYQSKHEADRINFFPYSEVVGVAGAGHWVHSEQPERFFATVLPFLAEEVPAF